MSAPHQGFVLHPTYRIEDGRPIVQLYGKLASGATFLVRDGRCRPRFYIREGDAASARALTTMPIAPCGRRTMQGEPVAELTFPTPPDGAPLRRRLSDAGIPCYEADVRFAMRYLIDRGIRGSMAITGPRRDGEGVMHVFDDPDLAPGTLVPALSVLSFDIETDPKAERVLSIALSGCGADEVHLLTPPGKSCPPGAFPVETEADLLRTFCRRARELDPDVITGWNVIDFDFTVLSRIAAKRGVKLALGRGPDAVRLLPARSVWGSSQASVPGRVVLDGLHALRGAFVRMEDHSLDAVAREVLGEGKLMGGPDRAEEILEAFENDRSLLCAYNLHDAQLVVGILDALKLVPLAIERSRLTGMPLDRVAGSVASFDFVYMSELGKRGIVAPTARADENIEAPMAGGHVLEPRPGIYENVLVLDFKSLYPSIIRTFQIDPLGYLPRPGEGDDPIVAPNGAAFRREPGILPGILDELFPRRERAKAAGDLVASNAIKILMNSFYGVLGTPACRFHNAEISNAITSFGRELLLWTKARLEEWGHEVLYGDTDSLFVRAGVPGRAQAEHAGHSLVRRVNEELARHVAGTWRVASKLELECKQLFLKLVLLPMRHGGGGARKRYAGWVEEGGKLHVVFTGMEAVRRDWTELAHRVQTELYEMLFAERPPAQIGTYLERTVADVRAGLHDDVLVYRKALRKGLEEYTAATPPHVVAARKLGAKAGRVISYVMTLGGAEPASARRNKFDHEHYVQKQVRPVAEPVLELLGLDFDRVVGDDRQLRLFD
ncbi:MAG: DNA polymerase II [Acidobacteriota bacterium]